MRHSRVLLFLTAVVLVITDDARSAISTDNTAIHTSVPAVAKDYLSATEMLAKPEWDALGLIGNASAMTRYGSEDTWEVWICDLPAGQANITSEAAARVLTAELVPYFAWLSEGQYRLRFTTGGAAQPSPDEAYPCQIQIEHGTGGDANGAFVITDESNIPRAFATPDQAYGRDVPNTFPANKRAVRIGAHVALPESRNFNPKRAAHELGHALGWPHSYEGDTDDASHYSNPLDVMSGDLYRDGELKGRPQGTLAINRYAAGWIEPSRARIHNAHTAEYLLGSVNSDGVQLVILDPDQRGTSIAVDARVDGGFDRGIKKEGVTVHAFDQSPEACGHSADAGCFGHDRRTRPIVGDRGSAIVYSHVLAPGDSLVVDNFRLDVLERVGDQFLLKVTNLGEQGQGTISSGRAGPESV